MSHFIALSILPIRAATPLLQEVAAAFDSRIEVREVQDTSFGVATAGHGTRRLAVAVTTGGTSTDLLGFGNNKRSLVDPCKDGMRRLCFEYGGIVVLLHFFRGAIATEEVTVVETVRVSVDQFLEKFPGIRENVRYVVTHDSTVNS